MSNNNEVNNPQSHNQLYNEKNIKKTKLLS